MQLWLLKTGSNVGQWIPWIMMDDRVERGVMFIIRKMEHICNSQHMIYIFFFTW